MIRVVAVAVEKGTTDMANPNFKPIYVPLALYDQIEKLRWQITLWRLQRKGNPRVPMHRVIEIAVRDAKLKERLDKETQNPPSVKE